MANFPTLKTGAVAQYPLVTASRFSDAGGAISGWKPATIPALMGNPLRQWSMKLDLLDDEELSAVIAFVEQQGSATFAFTDPVTGR